jgi:hypothetical protein
VTALKQANCRRIISAFVTMVKKPNVTVLIRLRAIYEIRVAGY